MKFFTAFFVFMFLVVSTNVAQAGLIRKAKKTLVYGGIATAVVVYSAKAKQRARCKQSGGFSDDCVSRSKTDIENDTILQRNPAGARELKKNLVQEREQEGVTPADPGSGCEPHHIVPEEEGRPWAKKNADIARMILKQCGIEINSSENGVFLPIKEGVKSNPNCPGSNHKKIHNEKYYAEIASRLDDAREQNCSAVKNELLNIKQELLSGRIFK